MDIGSSLATAASLMLTGMVGVFVFLSLLITAITILSKWVGSEDTTSQAAPIRTAKTTTDAVPAAHVAAISAAISQFKKQQ